MHPASSVDFDAVVTDMLTPKKYERKSAAVAAWSTRETIGCAPGDLAVWSAGAGPVVLLVHGWEGTHEDLGSFVAPLVAKGRRVVAPDLPAHGESSGTTASLYDFTHAVGSIGGTYGPIESIIAHSAGSPAAAMAIANGLRVERIALIAPPKNYERFVRWCAGELNVSADELVAAFGRRGVDVTTLDLPRTAATLDVPALITHSADDRTTLIAGSKAVAAAWRGSLFREVDGLGHSRILRDPGTIEAVVGFVTAGA